MPRKLKVHTVVRIKDTGERGTVQRCASFDGKYMLRVVGADGTVWMKWRAAKDLEVLGIHIPIAPKVDPCGDVGPEQTPDDTRTEIGRLVINGYTSGQLGGAGGVTTAWHIVYNTFKR